jgi:hypothetical protein
LQAPAWLGSPQGAQGSLSPPYRNWFPIAEAQDTSHPSSAPGSQGHASPRHRGLSPPPPTRKLQVPAAPAAGTSRLAAETPGRPSRGARAALVAGPGRAGRPVPRAGAGAGAAPRLLPPPPPPPPRGVSRKWPYWIHSAAAARAERVPQPACPCRGPGARSSPPARRGAHHGCY